MGKRTAVFVVELIILAVLVGMSAGWLPRQVPTAGAPTLSAECRLDWNCLECHEMAQK